MRNPSKGMPVGHFRGTDCPKNVGQRQSRLKMLVFTYIACVIVIDETVGESRPVGKNRDGRKQQRKQSRRSRIVDLRYSCALSRGLIGASLNGDGQRTHSFTLTPSSRSSLSPSSPH